MRKLDISRETLKFFKKLPDKHKKQIQEKIRELVINPTPSDSIALSGYKPYLRCDVGEYRIIYEYNDESLHIVLSGKRNDDEVYNKFKRRYK